MKTMFIALGVIQAQTQKCTLIEIVKCLSLGASLTFLAEGQLGITGGKIIRTELLCKKNFSLVGYTSWTTLSSKPVNLITQS